MYSRLIYIILEMQISWDLYMDESFYDIITYVTNTFGSCLQFPQPEKWKYDNSM